MKRVSIIVPVYNAEKYLDRCINSIVNQTLKDIEIILINDGSTDSSQEIIDKYMAEYPKIIKTKTIKNSGAANARNVGLEMSKGEYIGFVDGDDYIEKDMYEKLYNEANKENADIVVSAYFVEDENQIISYQVGKKEQYNKNIRENPNIFVYGVPYLWNKIFKRSLIIQNEIKFRVDLRIFEDLEFVYKLYLEANKISKVDEPLYYYIKENEKSLTAKFSDKFFDIIPAIKSLKEYCKTKEYYDEIEDYLIYIALNHIYIRCNMHVSNKNLKTKIKYINDVFSFLDSEFPKWKQHEYYYKNTKKNKKMYISKIYWKIKTYMQIFKLDKICKVLLGSVKRTSQYKKMGNIYIKYYNKLPLNEKIILLDSQHGNDMNGNMFYLLKELNNNINYKDYYLYLGVSKKRKKEFREKLEFYNLNHVELVENGTRKYMRLLATAKYLITDTSFVANYIKKDGQVYLNTWHGTPLKTLGRSNKNDFENIANLQKNFVVADYLLYPSEYMMEHMIEDYMIDTIAKNKILLCGYPRNSVFLDNERRNTVRKELKLSDKKLIAYMPTWRGTLNQKDTENYISELKGQLEYLEKKLESNQILYVNVHPYIKDYIDFKNYKNIQMFPNKYETYDFLNICDILITDYSSTFFDFALTRKKIILFPYDKERYLAERGLYMDLESLPFPKIYDVESLFEEIKSEKEIDYDSFVQQFCKYDNVDIPKQICERIILNKQNKLKLIDMPNNHKKNVLILTNNFSNKNINNQFFKLINNIEEYNYNYYVGYISKAIKKYSYNLLKLPKTVRYMGQLYSMCNSSLIDKILFKLHDKHKININFNSSKYEDILNKELKRIYGNIDFETVILFGEESEVRRQLFSKYEKSFKILYDTNLESKKYINIYNKVISIKEITENRNLNDIIQIGEKL